MLWGWGLKTLIKRGHLTVTDANNRVHHYGVSDGAPAVSIRLRDRALHWKLALNPGLYFGEAYMDETLLIESGSLHDLLTLFAINLSQANPSRLDSLVEGVDFLTRNWQQYNPIARASANVRHHYDLSDELYNLFLDADMQYSCAYFPDGDTSLEEAQYLKKRHIAAKLRLEPGMRVLDIGCGWGGMAIYLARETGVEVTGLTLSVAQAEKARERVKKAGLEKQVKICLQDYREEKGVYDRIVSVGMFEHVGIGHYPEFFAKLRSLLKPDGVALLHSIGRVDEPGTANPWLRKYIFPGAYAPSLSEVLPVIELGKLWVTDIEILRQHYARTLSEWHKRFNARRKEVAAMYDERFCRMWEFYLLSAEMEFSYMGTMVFQIQLTRDIDALPVTRDYMLDWERSRDCPTGKQE
ncbi:MAG: cyclopropane-fatty-acyl-phospholipid synthase [Deltaproteobacteria bacterium]|nr:cyclopropane-fatty-acyl-phospholipid synthase [Deltaproteobacteria bacterium]